VDILLGRIRVERMQLLDGCYVFVDRVGMVLCEVVDRYFVFLVYCSIVDVFRRWWQVR